MKRGQRTNLPILEDSMSSQEAIQSFNEFCNTLSKAGASVDDIGEALKNETLKIIETERKIIK